MFLAKKISFFNCLLLFKFTVHPNSCELELTIAFHFTQGAFVVVVSYVLGVWATNFWMKRDKGISNADFQIRHHICS